MNDIKKKRGVLESKYDISMIKWFLPMFLWKYITEFLLPEGKHKVETFTWVDLTSKPFIQYFGVDNIKLSLVSYSENAYLLQNKGEFLIPPSALKNKNLSPKWYSRKKFILNFKPWNEYSSHTLDRYFNCIVEITKAEIDGRCAQLPLQNILNLLHQSDSTLKELSITTFPSFNEETSFYQPCSDGSMDILRWMKPFDSISTKKKLFKLVKLKSLHIQGPFALAWMRILGCIDMTGLTHLSIELPPVCDLQDSSDIREIKKIITRFLFEFPNGQQFHLSVSPNDTTMYMVMRHCLAWIGSGSPSSKSFQFVKFESSNLNSILDSLKSHFYWILMKLHCPTYMLNNIRFFLLVALQRFNNLCLKDDCMTCKYLKSESFQHMLQLFNIIRLNVNLLKQIEFVGPITTWESFLCVKAILGPNVRLVVKKIQISIFNDWVSHVLYFTMEDVVTLKLEANLFSPNNSMTLVNQPMLVNSTNNLEHVNMEVSCQYLGATMKKFYFRNLSKLILAGVSLNSSEKLLDLASRLIVPNASIFVEKKFMETSSHKQTARDDDAQTEAIKRTKSETSNNALKKRNSEPSSLIKGKESYLTLEIWFSDTQTISYKNIQKIKTSRDKSIQKFYLEFVKRVITYFPFISITIYPCPTIFIFEEYHELLRASHYLIRNFTLEQTGNVSLYLTSQNHDNTNSHVDSEVPVITHLTLESFEAVQWVLQFLIENKYSYIFKNVQYLYINLFSETYIGLSLFFVNFLTKRNLNISDINTFLDHSYIYSLINLFNNTLEFITITYHLPLMVHMVPTHVTSCFFLSFREQLEKNISKTLYDSSIITMSIQLNPLDSLYLYPFLRFMEDTIKLCDDVMLDMITAKQREFNYLYEHQKFCQKEKNMIPLLTQKTIDLNTCKRDKFVTALGNLGVEIGGESTQDFHSNGSLIYPLQKSLSDSTQSQSDATLYNKYSLEKQYPNLLCYIESLLQLLSEEQAVTRESLLNYEKEEESLLEDECQTFYRFMTHLENQLKKSFSILLYYARQYDKISSNYPKDKKALNKELLLNSHDKIYNFNHCRYSKNENEFSNMQLLNSKENNNVWDFNNISSSQFDNKKEEFDMALPYNLEVESLRCDEINCSHWLPFQWNYHDSSFNKTIICQPYINGGEFTLTIMRKNR